VVRNRPGNWEGSTFFAFYLMDPSQRTTPAKAQKAIETDLDSVRRKAIAFVEMPYSGVVNRDANPLNVVIKLRDEKGA